jgi:hypothetical protein
VLKKIKQFGQKAVNSAIIRPITKEIGEKKMSGILITLGIVAAAVVLGVGSSYYLGDDNKVEEAAEKIIEDRTGINLDLSPSSPEKK